MADAGGIENNMPLNEGVSDGPADAVAIDAAPQTVGQRLGAAREALGLSLKDIAERTRITGRHVAAVEQGDYATLPGRPYAIGFARSYARAVGLDDTAIAEAVRAELDARAPAPEARVIHQFEVGDPVKTPSRLVGWLAVLLIVAIFGMGLVFWRSYYWPSAELPALVGAEAPAAAHAATAPQRATAPAPAAVNGPVVFTALEDAIWVKFYDGAGKQLLQKQLAKGESYTVPADAVDPKLWTGRPDALAITIGGQPAPRLGDKEGIMKDVAVSAPALRQRAATSAPVQPAPARLVPASAVPAPAVASAPAIR